MINNHHTQDTQTHGTNSLNNYGQIIGSSAPEKSDVVVTSLLMRSNCEAIHSSHLAPREGQSEKKPCLCASSITLADELHEYSEKSSDSSASSSNLTQRAARERDICEEQLCAEGTALAGVEVDVVDAADATEVLVTDVEDGAIEDIFMVTNFVRSIDVEVRLA